MQNYKVSTTLPPCISSKFTLNGIYLLKSNLFSLRFSQLSIINKIWNSYKALIIAALVIRLVAATFSQGYGMHDDHFLIIEAASSWTDDYDYNYWLPSTPGNDGPEGHSFTYVGMNYYFFKWFKGIGIQDPKILMFFNRLIHALFSMLIVVFGFKITEKLTDRKKAFTVGWILALLWVLPFLSVRNLVEVTCIPFILWSIWLMVKEQDLEVIKQNRWNFLFAGLLMGMAVSFRYQVGVFALGFAAVYFFQWKWWKFSFFSLGVLITFGITQGLVDYIIWGYPFAELTAYFTYNLNEGTGYIPNSNYTMYLLVLMGSMLIPLGLLFGIGFFRGAKKYFFLFVPTLLFIIFHSIYPSKQERFILPVLPIFIILGVLGYAMLMDKKAWKNLWLVSMKIFWVVNIPMLFFASTTYSKKSRVEAMYYFYNNHNEGHWIMLETTGETGASMVPRFYAGDWFIPTHERTKERPEIVDPEFRHYDHILFYGQENLEERIAEFKAFYPNMELAKICEPSLADKLLRWMNPRNRNEYIEIWKTNYPEN